MERNDLNNQGRKNYDKLWKAASAAMVVAGSMVAAAAVAKTSHSSDESNIASGGTQASNLGGHVETEPQEVHHYHHYERPVTPSSPVPHQPSSNDSPYHVDQIIETKTIEVEGRPVTQVTAIVNGHPAVLFDIEQDGHADLMFIDNNNDGQISESEQIDLTQSNFSIDVPIPQGNPNPSDDVQVTEVLGYDHIKTDEGDDIDVATVKYNSGKLGLIVDADHDGMADAYIVDENENGKLTDDNFVKIDQSNTHVQMNALAQQAGYEHQESLDAPATDDTLITQVTGQTGPDYINDADVSIVNSSNDMAMRSLDDDVTIDDGQSADLEVSGASINDVGNADTEIESIDTEPSSSYDQDDVVLADNSEDGSVLNEDPTPQMDVMADNNMDSGLGDLAGVDNTGLNEVSEI